VITEKISISLFLSVLQTKFDTINIIAQCKMFNLGFVKSM